MIIEDKNAKIIFYIYVLNDFLIHHQYYITKDGDVI